ncbi:MAG TPA: hypothetical protein VF857_06655 [Spirochaetota bacterium]
MKRSAVMKISITLFLLIQIFHRNASAAFSYGSNEGEGLFPFPTPACEEKHADPSSVPAYAPLQRGAYFRCSYLRPYGIEALNSWGSSAGFGNGSVGAGLFWNHFGFASYTEDRIFLYGGLCLPGGVLLGSRIHADRFRIAIDDYSSTHTVYDGDAMLLLHPFPALSIACRQDNIAAIFRKKNRDILYPESSFGVLVSPARGISCGWNYLHTSFGGVNAWNMRATILSSFSVSAGYARETSTYALNANLLFRKMTITYGFNYHAYLGATHHVVLTFNTESIQYDPIVMHRERVPEDYVINIATCGVDDLERISKMTDDHAERIVRYRDLIGPVTEKVLYQLGLSKGEVDELESHSTGIADDESVEKEEKKKYIPTVRNYKPSHKAQVKSLFIRLVEGGISPVAALKIADAVGGKNGTEAARIIDTIESISKNEKDKAKALCAK